MYGKKNSFQKKVPGLLQKNEKKYSAVQMALNSDYIYPLPKNHE